MPLETTLSSRAGEMAQWLRGLAVLPEDHSLVRALILGGSQEPITSEVLFWPPRAHVCMFTYTLTDKQNQSFRRERDTDTSTCPEPQ